MSDAKRSFCALASRQGKYSHQTVHLMRISRADCPPLEDMSIRIRDNLRCLLDVGTFHAIIEQSN